MERGDATIVRASVRRPELFEQIFDRHHGAIWGFLARLGGRECADDLAGEVFLTAFAQRDRYQPDRGSVRSWLFGIAANMARTRSRRHRRAARALARVASREVAEATPTGAVDDAIADRDHLDRVREAIARLPARDREVLVLFAWEGLSYQAIAEALGVEVGTVRSRLARARARLRELLAPSGQVTDDDHPPATRTMDDA